METFQGHICYEDIYHEVMNLHFNSSVLLGTRIGYFLVGGLGSFLPKEIEKKYIAFSSPKINRVSNIDGTKFLVLLRRAERWC